MLNGQKHEPRTPAPVTEVGYISCARTNDGGILRMFYMEPEIWEPMKDDGSPEAIDVDFDHLVSDPDSDHCIFVTSSVNGNIAGLFMFASINISCYEIHSALLPEYWGLGMASALGKKACIWMFENTTCEKVTTHVPAYNEPARRMAMGAGMKLEGCNRESFMKDGVLHDQLLFGFTKREVLCL